MILEKCTQIINDGQGEIDSNAYVFRQPIASEPEQCCLVHDAIILASKLAVVTTYGIKPIGKEKISGTVSNTTFAILSALAERQDDKAFNFFLLYNKQTYFQKKIVGQRTNITLNNTQNYNDYFSWMDVINTYNRQVKRKEFDRTFFNNPKCLTNISFNFYVIEADPKLSASHHNKYCINDNSFASTLGASLLNRSKIDWYDSGIAFKSKRLTKFVLKHFLSYQVKKTDTIHKIVKNEYDKKHISMEVDYSAINKIITNIEIKDNKYLNNKKCLLFLEDKEIDFFGKIMWVNNIGRDPGIFQTRQPIETIFRIMVSEAREDDILFFRNGSWSSLIEELIKVALKKGCYVKLLMPFYADSNRAIAKRATSLYNFYKSVYMCSGKFELRFFFPDRDINSLHNISTTESNLFLKNGFIDHGKVYGLLSKAGKSMIMTGTHNMDIQSFSRSHENMVLIEPNRVERMNDIYNNLFNDFWLVSDRFSLEDLRTLSNCFITRFSNNKNWSNKLPDAFLDKHRRILYPSYNNKERDSIFFRIKKNTYNNEDEQPLIELTKIINEILPGTSFIRSNRKMKSLIIARNEIVSVINRESINLGVNVYLKKIIEISIIIRGNTILSQQTKTARKLLEAIKSNRYPYIAKVFRASLDRENKLTYNSLIKFIDLRKGTDLGSEETKLRTYLNTKHL